MGRKGANNSSGCRHCSWLLFGVVVSILLPYLVAADILGHFADSTPKSSLSSTTEDPDDFDLFVPSEELESAADRIFDPIIGIGESQSVLEQNNRHVLVGFD